MFIEQYRLKDNPFAADRVRPFFASHAVRYSSLKIAQLLEGQIQCLFLSGPTGAGKSTLVERQLRSAGHVENCWLEPGVQKPEDFLHLLLKDVGPGAVEGTVPELRNILHVYLQHQASLGQQSLIVIDDLEGHSADVLNEIETLSRLKLRNRPVAQFVMMTQHADLIDSLISQLEGGYLARAVHYQLMGFTLEETEAYIRKVLEGAGCQFPDELIPTELFADIQAFSRGVVGDINELCGALLEELAVREGVGAQQIKVTRALLKDVGARLHLRYDPAAMRRQLEESAHPDAVQQQDRRELKIEAARLLVSSGGQLVAEINLNRPRMVLGRDHSCDISLNSSFVSRYQNLFMETDEGWVLIDLNSTNGCFVNGRKVSEHRLRDGDLISVGHHQLRFSGSTTLRGGDDPNSDRTSTRLRSVN